MRICLFLLLAAPFLIAQPEDPLPPRMTLPAPDQAGRVWLDDKTFLVDDIAWNKDDVARKGWSSTPWTDGIVPYRFGPWVSERNRDRVREAVREWESAANIVFIELADDETRPNFLEIFNGGGNWSYLGMRGGRQLLSMYSWHSKYVIMHELSHALGFSHEQSRSDRDEYVTILWDNIVRGEHNFRKDTTNSTSPYDFRSIMHYSSTAFGDGNRTIQANPGYEEFQGNMGNRRYLSHLDARDMAEVYPGRTATITDEAFKAYLVANFDTDGDGEIGLYEATLIESIETPGEGQIKSLEGLSFLRGLKRLVVAGEALSALPELPVLVEHVDVRGNTALQFSDCHDLGRVLKSGGTVETDMACLSEALLAEDLFNPTLHAYLVANDDINGDGRINRTEADLVTRIDPPDPEMVNSLKGLAELTNLEWLVLDEQTVDDLSPIAQAAALTTLIVIDSPVNGLPDLSHLPNFRRLDIIGAGLTTAPDVSNLSRLEVLILSNNQLTQLSELPESLYYLSVSNNQLTSLPDVDHIQRMNVIFARGNQLTRLPRLHEGNLLFDLDVRENNMSSSICGTLTDLALNEDFVLVINPQNYGDFSCDRDWWFPGVNVDAGTYTLHVVNHNAEDPQMNSAVVTGYDGAGNQVYQGGFPIEAGGKETWTVPAGEIRAIKLSGARGLSAMLSFAGDNGRDFAYKGGNYLLENAFTPHVARDTASWRTRIFTAGQNTSTADYLLETFQADPLATVPSDHKIDLLLSPLASLNVDLAQTLGDEVIANSTLARTTTGLHHGFLAFGSKDDRGIGALPLQREKWLSERLFFPHVTTDPNWWTGLSLVNPTDQTASLDVWTRDVNNNWVFNNILLQPRSNDVRQAANFFNDPIEGGMRFMMVFSSRPISGMLLFGYSDSGAFAGLQATRSEEADTNLVFPYIKNDGDHWTGLVLYNTSSSDRALTMRGYGADGALLSETEWTIEGYQRLSQGMTGEQSWFPLNDENAARLAYVTVEAAWPMAGMAIISRRDAKGISGYSALTPWR